MTVIQPIGEREVCNLNPDTTRRDALTLPCNLPFLKPVEYTQGWESERERDWEESEIEHTIVKGIRKGTNG